MLGGCTLNTLRNDMIERNTVRTSYGAKHVIRHEFTLVIAVMAIAQATQVSHIDPYDNAASMVHFPKNAQIQQLRYFMSVVVALVHKVQDAFSLIEWKSDSKDSYAATIQTRSSSQQAQPFG